MFAVPNYYQMAYYRIASLIMGKTEKTGVQILRNAVVECVRYFTNIMLLWIFTDFMLGPDYLPLSTALSAFFVGLLNYTLSSLWVFNKREKGTSSNIKRFVVFSVIGIPGLGLVIGITTLLTNMGVYYLLSNSVAQMVVFFFNFFMRRKILFSE